MPERRGTYWNDYLASLEHPEIKNLSGAHAAAMLPPTVGVTGGALADKLGPTDSTLSISPWWEREYESAQNWYIKNLFVTLPSAPAGTVTVVPSFSFMVPALARMVLKQFTLLITSPLTTTDVTCALLRNGQTIPGFDILAFLPMAVSTQALPFNDVNIRFGGQDTFTAQFTNNNATTAWSVGIQASGWFVQQADIDRLQGGFRY